MIHRGRQDGQFTTRSLEFHAAFMSSARRRTAAFDHRAAKYRRRIHMADEDILLAHLPLDLQQQLCKRRLTVTQLYFKQETNNPTELLNAHYSGSGMNRESFAELQDGFER
jgi:hypothetical protein